MPLDNQLLTQIEQARQANNLDQVCFLLNKLIDETKEENLYRLHEMIVELLRKLAQPNESELTNFQLAAKYGTAKALDILFIFSLRYYFKYIHDVNALGTNAFVLAIVSKHEAKEKLDIMFKYYANINEPLQHGTNEPLLPIVYVLRHNPDLLPYFLERKAQIEPKNGVPIIYYAAVEKNETAVDLFLQRGANINANLGQPNNPLIKAANENQFEAITFLLSKGAVISGPTQLFLNYFKQTWDDKLFQFATNLLILRGLQFHYAENFLNVRKFYDYFYTENEMVNSYRRAAFTNFPCLFELVHFTEQGVSLPENIEKTIDTSADLSKELENHYGVAHSALVWLPAPYSEIISVNDLLMLIKANILPPNMLPGFMQKASERKRVDIFNVTNEDNVKLKEDQSKLFFILSLCKMLVQAAFKHSPNSEREQQCFLSLVSSTINREKLKGKLFWEQTFEALPITIQKSNFLLDDNTEKLIQDVMSALEDYMHCAIWPQLIRALHACNIPIAIQTELLAENWFNLMKQLAFNYLFQGVSIDKIFEFAQHWAAHPVETIRKTHKGLTDRIFTWEPYVPVDSIPTIPEDSLPEAKGWRVVPLTSQEDLEEEGKKLRICIGSNVEDCYLGLNHFFSIHDANNVPVSVFQIVVNQDKKSSYVMAHVGEGNQQITQYDLTYKVFAWFLQTIHGKVNFRYLEEKRLQRNETENSLYEQLKLKYLFFDPMDVGQSYMVFQDYRLALTDRKSKESTLHRNFDALSYAVFGELAQLLQTSLSQEENNNNNNNLIPNLKLSKEMVEFLLDFCQQIASEYQPIISRPIKKSSLVVSKRETVFGKSIKPTNEPETPSGLTKTVTPSRPSNSNG